jgi:hypothetical protein
MRHPVEVILNWLATHPMTDGFETALIAAIGGVVGGLVTGSYSHLRSWFTRPRLAVDYANDDGHLCSFDKKNWEDKDISAVYVRIKVMNEGRRVARGCRVFLTGLEEVHPSGETTQTSLHEALVLGWPKRDFEPRDIPRGVPFYADVVAVSKHGGDWNICVKEMYANHDQLPKYRGTYRFHVVVTGDEAEPVRCTVDATYDGDWHNFRAIPIT